MHGRPRLHAEALGSGWAKMLGRKDPGMTMLVVRMTMLVVRMTMWVGMGSGKQIGTMVLADGAILAVVILAVLPGRQTVCVRKVGGVCCCGCTSKPPGPNCRTCANILDGC